MSNPNCKGCGNKNLTAASVAAQKLENERLLTQRKIGSVNIPQQTNNNAPQVKSFLDPTKRTMAENRQLDRKSIAQEVSKRLADLRKNTDKNAQQTDTIKPQHVPGMPAATATSDQPAQAFYKVAEESSKQTAQWQGEIKEKMAKGLADIHQSNNLGATNPSIQDLMDRLKEANVKLTNAAPTVQAAADQAKNTTEEQVKAISMQQNMMNDLRGQFGKLETVMSELKDFTSIAKSFETVGAAVENSVQRVSSIFQEDPRFAGITSAVLHGPIQGLIDFGTAAWLRETDSSQNLLQNNAKIGWHGFAHRDDKGRNTMLQWTDVLVLEDQKPIVFGSVWNSETRRLNVGIARFTPQNDGLKIDPTFHSSPLDVSEGLIQSSLFAEEMIPKQIGWYSDRLYALATIHLEGKQGAAFFTLKDATLDKTINMRIQIGVGGCIAVRFATRKSDGMNALLLRVYDAGKIRTAVCLIDPTGKMDSKFGVQFILCERGIGEFFIGTDLIWSDQNALKIVGTLISNGGKQSVGIIVDYTLKEDNDATETPWSIWPLLKKDEEKETATGKCSTVSLIGQIIFENADVRVLPTRILLGDNVVIICGTCSPKDATDFQKTTSFLKFGDNHIQIEFPNQPTIVNNMAFDPVSKTCRLVGHVLNNGSDRDGADLFTATHTSSSIAVGRIPITGDGFQTLSSVHATKNGFVAVGNAQVTRSSLTSRGCVLLFNNT